MTREQHLPRTRRPGLLALIILVAVGARLAAAAYLGNEVVVLPGTADQLSYHTLATRILDGHGFTFGEAWWPVTPAGEETAHWSYLYTLALVGLYQLFGVQPLLARLLQAVVVGVLAPWLAYALAHELWRHDDAPASTTPTPADERVALLAAAITAVYIYFVYYAAALMTEALFITAVMAILYFAVRLATAPRRLLLTTLLLALSIAIAVLLRQLILLFLPFLFLWMLAVAYRQGRLRTVFLCQVVVVLVLVAAILPATLYNFHRFDRFVLLNTNAGFAIYWANHPIHGTQFIPASEMGETYQRLVPAELRGLDEAALDQALLREAIDFVVAEPGRYLQLSLSRIPAYFRFWPASTSSLISNLSRVGSFALFLPFMLIGVLRPLVAWARGGKRPSPTMLLLYLFILVYTGIHVLTWALVRYRLPVDAVLILFAAAGLEPLLARAARRFAPGATPALSARANTTD